MSDYEVGIIGAGVHGASVAAQLAKLDIRTVVFEKEVPAGGPTGRSSAVVRGWYTNHFLARMAIQSLEMFENFTEITEGGDASFRRTGVVFMHPEEDREHVEKTAKYLNSIGGKFEVIDVGAIADLFPSLNPDSIGVGAWEPLGGFADPVGTTKGFLEWSGQRGVDLRLRTDVTKIETLESGGARVSTGDGAITTCRRLLIAAGPWSAPLAAHVGADIPLSVERHIIASFGWADAQPVPFVYSDVPQSIYVKPDGEELFIVGELDSGLEVDPNDYNQEIDDEESMTLGEAVVQRIPHLAEAEARGGWASLYDMSPDWQPVIGEVADGIFIDAGSSGHGFKLAPALGGEIAKLMLDRDPDPDIHQFHPRRFTEGRDLSSDFGTAKIMG